MPSYLHFSDYRNQEFLRLLHLYGSKYTITNYSDYLYGHYRINFELNNKHFMYEVSTEYLDSVFNFNIAELFVRSIIAQIDDRFKNVPEKYSATKLEKEEDYYKWLSNRHRA